jgi:hypothetical protein
MPLGKRCPCQWMLVCSGSLLVTKMRTRSPSTTSIVGPWALAVVAPEMGLEARRHFANHGFGHQMEFLDALVHAPRQGPAVEGDHRVVGAAAVLGTKRRHGIGCQSGSPAPAVAAMATRLTLAAATAPPAMPANLKNSLLEFTSDSLFISGLSCRLPAVHFRDSQSRHWSVDRRGSPARLRLRARTVLRRQWRQSRFQPDRVSQTAAQRHR